MAKVKSYINKKGQKRFQFQAYLGTNKTTGKAVQVTRTGFKSAREANITLSRLQYEFDHSIMASDAYMTYSDVFEAWKQVYSLTVTESTQNRVFGLFRIHIIPVIGSMYVKDINLQTCQHLIDDIAPKVKGVRKIGNYMSRVFKYAQKREYIEKNPMQFVTYPKRKPEKHKDFWDRKQLNKFLDILDRDYTNQPKIRACLRLIAVTGARKAEILGLKLSDIDYNDKSIRIEQAVVRTLDNTQTIGDTKTFNSQRTLYVDDKTIEIIHEWQKQLQKFLIMRNIELSPDQLLFPDEQNKPTSVMKPNRWLEKIIQDNNLKRITPHGLRATMATILSEAGLPLKATALMLGDTEAVVLKYYIQQDEKMRQDSAKEYQNYLGL